MALPALAAYSHSASLGSRRPAQLAYPQRRNRKPAPPGTEGRAYYERKRAAGKPKREALRCLKRKLSDIVFTTMRDDADRQTPQLGHLPPPNQAGVGAADANEARLTA